MATILLIDDDEMMRHAITMALSTRGHVTVVAEDGIAGLDTFANAVFDLVITDIVMPWMEGLEIVRSIRERDANIPIIAISGGGANFGMNYLEHARQFGAQATMKKPLNYLALLDTVAELLSTSAESTPG